MITLFDFNELTNFQHLFCRMNWLGMNMYMYAPKDDYKHRQNWRELYTSRELVELRELAEEATRQRIRFVYALSPGLDIRFSDSSELDAIYRVHDYVIFTHYVFIKILDNCIQPIRYDYYHFKMRVYSIHI